jgi:hypothetical protein
LPFVGTSSFSQAVLTFIEPSATGVSGFEMS